MKGPWEGACWSIAVVLAFAGLWSVLIEPDKVAAFCFLILASQWVTIAELGRR